MSLKHLFEQICCSDLNMLPEEDPIGLRIMCPEYSLHAGDTKTYPVSITDPLFALCWCMNGSRRLYGTIKPASPSFSYSCPYEPGDRTQIHTHEYLELAYVISGRFRQCIQGKDILFSQGELCLIDKNCLHQDYLDQEPASILFLGIANEMFEQIMARHITAERIAAFLQSALLTQKNHLQFLHFSPNTEQSRQRMERCMLQLLEELICHDGASPTICQGLLIRVFGLLSTGYSFSLSRELKKEMDWLLYQEITAYIQAHCRDITLRELVRQFHYQEDYFNRLLKAKTGKTYTAYVQDKRLERAAALLTDTDRSIEEIAREAGYENKGYFYKIFLERYQVTPARFRKEKRSRKSL